MDNTDNTQSYADLKFSIADQQLIVVAIPDQRAAPIDIQTIKQLLRESGYDSHDLSDDVYQQLISLSASNSDDKVPLEPHRDASFEILIDQEQLQASIKFIPAFCGQDLNQEQLMNALLEAGIQSELIETDQITNLLASNQEVTLCVARGKAPERGQDASINVLFETDRKDQPLEMQNGKVNHYETHSYSSVEKDAHLMRRTPPTPGIAGHTVFGATLEPEAGTDMQFDLNDTVRLDSDDPDLLIADKSGHPIVQPRGVQIDDTLSLASASLETGNVHFEGSVEIKGDVSPNVVVKASGDIFVSGTVENAHLISGNNIVLLAGVLSSRSHEEQQEQSEQQPDLDYKCRIEAQNTIQMKYCNLVFARSKGTILIQDYSLHSYLKAKDDVIAGIENGKGILLGGEIHAGRKIEAKIIGSEAYVATHLFCGDTRKIKTKYRKNRKRLEQLSEELSMLNKILNDIKAKGSPAKVGQLTLMKARKVYQEIQTLTQELAIRRRKVEKFRARLNPQHANYIRVEKTCYPNTYIVINEMQTRTSQSHQSCRIEKSDKEIEFNQGS